MKIYIDITYVCWEHKLLYSKLLPRAFPQAEVIPSGLPFWGDNSDPGAFVVVEKNASDCTLQSIRDKGMFPIRGYIFPKTNTRKYEVYGPLGVV